MEMALFEKKLLDFKDAFTLAGGGIVDSLKS